MRIVDSFDVYVNKPLDFRFSVGTKDELNSLGNSNKSYNYMRVVCEEDETIYQLKKTDTEVKWTPLRDVLNKVSVKSKEISGVTDDNGNLNNLDYQILYCTPVGQYYGTVFKSSKVSIHFEGGGQPLRNTNVTTTIYYLDIV